MSTPKPKYERKKFPTIEQMHASFEINCCDAATLPKIQAIEMKKAFMAGVASLFQVIKFEIPEVSDEEGVGYLERLDAQLVQFFTIDIFKLKA